MEEDYFLKTIFSILNLLIHQSSLMIIL